MSEIPKEGTRAAVEYWAVRARQSTQSARFHAGFSVAGPSHRDMKKARHWAADAAGSACEMQMELERFIASLGITEG